MLYGQVMSALFDVRAAESEIIKECKPTSEALATMKDIQKRFGEYLTAYDKFDQADRLDEKAKQLAELRQQYQRYAHHCRVQISEAWDDFKAGEIFVKGRPTWGNAQAKLKEGLAALYSVDEIDLRRANPGVHEEWLRIEGVLKKHYEGTPSKVNAETPKKSLNDF